MNLWIGMGRLTQDPEVRNTTNGNMVCSFTIAIDRKYSNGGEKKTDFINCVAWKNTAEFISKYFTKGSMIAVEGTMQVRNWEDNDGNKRYATEAIVNSVHFCGSKNENSGSVNSGKVGDNLLSKAEDAFFNRSSDTGNDEEDPF